MHDQDLKNYEHCGVRHGLRLIKTGTSSAPSSPTLSSPALQLVLTPSEVRPKNKLAAQLSTLADAIDAEVAMILKL